MIRTDDFPVVRHDYVTEGHARVCRERGHASWIVDGALRDVCPRCGDPVTHTPQERADAMRDHRRAQLAAGEERSRT